ncbi:MAG TPA: glycosyltransferase family 2 protein [Patescibacteria group bacterium]|nr:glycosyltransferase family 2 protein [bacterium]HRT11063.1 glycosyltransferase family 2 protein [Patescibacteria group bacterium]HRU89762.1 glycosyltransferase family 2 protein [Patescibacteria group bacterium]
MKIVCVIPAWNEAKTIVNVIQDVKKHVDEVIVVDDGSEDKTANLAHSAGATVLVHRLNRGQGAALRTGTIYALNHGADIIVHFDADGQFTAQDIPKVIAPIVQGEADIVFGSRFLGAEHNMPPFKKRVVLPLARLFNLVFLGVRVRDPQNGFRALSAKAARQLNWQQDRMAHCSEILWLTRKAKLRYQEVGVKVKYNDFGQKMSGGWKIIGDLFLGRFLK